MRSSQNKLDLLAQAYSKNWLRSLKSTHASSSLGFFMTGMFVFLWASDLTLRLGYHPTRGLGSLIFVSFGLALALIVILVNSLLARTGIDRTVRSGLWLAAVLGPYIGLLVQSRWKNPTLGHLAGFGSAVLAFWISLLLDKLIRRSTDQKSPGKPEQKP